MECIYVLPPRDVDIVELPSFTEPHSRTLTVNEPLSYTDDENSVWDKVRKDDNEIRLIFTLKLELGMRI